jgi:hypothetical protein
VGQLVILRIEIDGSFRGSPNVPKPWVARITGTDPKFGLAREFVAPMNDWSNAHVAHSGNLYHRVSQFNLREGNLYEVSKSIGKPSKRRVVREFFTVTDGAFVPVDPDNVSSVLCKLNSSTT